MNENDCLIDENIYLKNMLQERSHEKPTKNDKQYYREQIDMLENKVELLNNKLQNKVKDRDNYESLNTKAMQNNKQLYSRYEETNAALERAFDRISNLEADNNR